MAKEIGTNDLIDTWASGGIIIAPGAGKVDDGWEFEEQPPHEFMNWLQNGFGRQINYLMRSGVPEWNAATDYAVGSYVSLDGKLWGALTVNTNSEPSAGNTGWQAVPTGDELAAVAITGDVGSLTGLGGVGQPGVVPSGGVIMWSGSVADIPSGYLLCNGSNGTPDLRGRFVIGAGGSYPVGNTGGSETVEMTAAQMPAHTHSAGTLSAASAGSHQHSGTTSGSGGHSHNYRQGSEYVRVPNTGNLTVGYLDVNFSNNERVTSPVADHAHAFTTAPAGAHTHDITGATGSAGSGSAHENRPPFYALCYIMKS